MALNESSNSRSNAADSDRGWTTLVLVFALTIRIGAACYWQDSADRDGTLLRFGDSHSYWTMASNLTHGQSFQYGSAESKLFRAPLYPLLLAPFTILGTGEPNHTSVLLVRFTGCAIGTWTVWLIMLFARRLGGKPCSRIAGLLASVYPGAVGMSLFVLSEAIATPLFVASCYGLWLVIDRFDRADINSPPERNRDSDPTQLSDRAIASNQSPLWWVKLMLLAGGCLGLACLARPSWSLWPVVVIPFLWTATRRSPSWSLHRRLLAIFLFCMGMGLAMAPWWVRNYTITGKWVPTTLQVGASLYDGWHPGASGSSDENMDFVMDFLVAQQAEDAMLAKQGLPLESTLEWRLDRRMRRAAFAWACENPSDVVRLGLVKLRKTWMPLPVAREVSNPWIRWSEAFGVSFLAITAWVGAWRLRRVRGAWLGLMPCVYLAILHAIFIGSVRYRQPGVLLLCPLAAVGCAAIMEWIQHRRNGTSEHQRETA
jgi:4-amino-4-deoxy-L-arabinose transferase-like glycosyltransferase